MGLPQFDWIFYHGNNIINPNDRSIKKTNIVEYQITADNHKNHLSVLEVRGKSNYKEI